LFPAYTSGFQCEVTAIISASRCVDTTFLKTKLYYYYYYYYCCCC